MGGDDDLDRLKAHYLDFKRCLDLEVKTKIESGTASYKDLVWYAYQVVVFDLLSTTRLLRILPHVIIRPRVRSSISVVPGHYLQSMLRFVYTQKTFDAVFAQGIKDMRDEYFEALERKARWKSRWVKYRGITGILLTVVLHAVTTLGKNVQKIWKVTP